MGVKALAVQRDWSLAPCRQARVMYQGGQVGRWADLLCRHQCRGDCRLAPADQQVLTVWLHVTCRCLLLQLSIKLPSSILRLLQDPSFIMQ